MRASIVAAVLIAPALIGARPAATPGTKMVLNPDTYSPPALSGAPMPTEHTSPHNFADGVTDEGLRKVIEGRDKTLANPKEEIIVHPYRPFADPTKDRDREHFELYEKAHRRGFHQNMRNTDDTERPHPDDHHLGPKIGTPKNARATDDTEQRPHPNDNHLGPNIGTPKNARAIDYTAILPHPNGHLLPPKIGTPINARAIDNTERPHPFDHHLGPNIGTPKNARFIDITERPHPNDHHLGPKIGTPINAKREESEESGDLEEILVDLPISSDYYPEEFDDLEETPVDLPISLDSYPDNVPEELYDLEEIPVDLPISLDYYYPDYDPEEFDDLEEVPVDLPIPSDYYPEEFDDLEEMPVDLPLISDNYPESSDYEDPRYIPETPGDRNVRRPGRLAGPPFPCAGPLHFNGTGFNNTINGTAFNTTINGTAFNNATNITTEAISCFKGPASDSEELAEPTLNRRGQGHTGALPEVIQNFENQRQQQQAQKAAQNQAAKDESSKEKADREKAIMERKTREKETKEKNRGSSGKNRPNKSSPNIMDHAPELFEHLKDPFNKPFPYEDDEEFSDDFVKNLDKLRHPLYWTSGADKTEHPKQESGHGWHENPRPKTSDEKTGFNQGDGWKTDYWQKGLGIQQPRVPQAHQPYWTEGNPVY